MTEATLARECSECGAPGYDERGGAATRIDERGRCPTCTGTTALAGKLSAGLDVRALLCAHCGAPALGPPSGAEISCPFCGSTVTMGSLALESLRLARWDEPQEQRRSSEGSSGMASPGRRERLWAQIRTQEPSPYDLSQCPAGLERLARLEPDDLQTPYELHAAFWEARRPLQGRAKGRGGGAYRQAASQEPRSQDDERRVCWIAHRAVQIFAERQESLRARPLVEQAYELCADPGWRQRALCDLAALAESVGDLTAAAKWLEACDPAPPWIELDSLVRLRRGRLAVRQQAWAEVLEAAGEHHDRTPVFQAHQIEIALLRIAALERLGRSDDADAELRALVDVHLVVDVKAALAVDEITAPARAAWQRQRETWRQEAWRKRRAALRSGAIFGAIGLVALPIAMAVFYGGTMNTLHCERRGDQAAYAPPSCRIIETLLGTPVDQRPVQGLQGARLTASGTSDNRSSELLLLTAEGEQPFASCTKCQSDLEMRRALIQRFIEQTSEERLTIDEPDENPAPWIGIFGSLAAVAMMVLGLGGIIRTLLRKIVVP